MILTRQIHNAKNIPEVADAHIYSLYVDDLLTMPLRSLGRIGDHLEWSIAQVIAEIQVAIIYAPKIYTPKRI